MPHIKLPEGLPGIIGPMTAYPETAKPLNELAEVLLCKDTKTFSRADRESIASYVSFLNQCSFCCESHAGVADYHKKENGFARRIWEKADDPSLPARLRALLHVAKKLQASTQGVSTADVEAARKEGATDEDIHDTVLIAAAFCMFNRYVDGLATMAPPPGDPAYKEMGKMLGTVGYKNAIKHSQG